MNENLKIISDARKMIKVASAQLSDSYNDLCGSTISTDVLSVLDGALRTATQLEKLEQFYAKPEEEPDANEYELKKYISAEG